jgi:hypothetical protein
MGWAGPAAEGKAASWLRSASAICRGGQIGVGGEGGGGRQGGGGGGVQRAWVRQEGRGPEQALGGTAPESGPYVIRQTCRDIAERVKRGHEQCFKSLPGTTHGSLSQYLCWISSLKPQYSLSPHTWYPAVPMGMKLSCGGSGGGRGGATPPPGAPG